MSRPVLEVADVVRQYGEAYLARYSATVSPEQRRVLRAIAACRTAALGGHLTQCDHGDHAENAYNSCRNRHCPKCQGSAQAAWLAARERELLDVPYCHVVFTRSCTWPLRINPPGLPVDRHRSKKAWRRELSWLPSTAHRAWCSPLLMQAGTLLSSSTLRASSPLSGYTHCGHGGTRYSNTSLNDQT